MKTYFIENYQGEWLRSLEDHGDMWTTDPLRAWRFDFITGVYFMDMSNHDSRLTPWRADDVIRFLQEELPGQQLSCTEHEQLGDGTTWKHWVQPHLRKGYPSNTTWRYMYYLSNLTLESFGRIISNLGNQCIT